MRNFSNVWIYYLEQISSVASVSGHLGVDEIRGYNKVKYIESRVRRILRYFQRNNYLIMYLPKMKSAKMSRPTIVADVSNDHMWLVSVDLERESTWDCSRGVGGMNGTGGTTLVKQANTCKGWDNVIRYRSFGVNNPRQKFSLHPRSITSQIGKQAELKCSGFECTCRPVLQAWLRCRDMTTAL